MIVPALDVYVTYKCNLRCSHCFMGNSLDKSTDFNYPLLAKLIESAHQWQAREITFLGGEPTLYPYIADAVSLAFSVGLDARLVTNGLSSFRRFIERFNGSRLPTIGFSIDGATAETHDAIRGAGTLQRLIPNVVESRRRGYPSFAILSVSRTNVDDVIPTLDLCDELGMSHVNIHYVSNRGFAGKDMVLTIDEWAAVCDEVRNHGKRLSLDVRIEETFVPASPDSGFCAIRAEDNLMFLPDGRVFMCPMFIDVPGAYSYLWTANGLVANRRPRTEREIAARPSAVHCPAMPLVNSEISRQVAERGMIIKCVFDKTRLRRGASVADSE